MEHLLCKYMPYSQLVWIRLGEIITQYLNSFSQDLIPRVQTTQLNVIYNVPHLHNRDKVNRNAFLILTQEIKHDIIYR